MENLSTRLETLVNFEEVLNKRCFICHGDFLKTDIITIHAGLKDEDGIKHPFHAICGEPWLKERESCGTCKKKIVNVTEYFEDLDYLNKTFSQKIVKAGQLTTQELVKVGVPIVDGFSTYFDFTTPYFDRARTGLKAEDYITLVSVILLAGAHFHLGKINALEKEGLDSQLISDSDIYIYEQLLFQSAGAFLAQLAGQKIWKSLTNFVNRCRSDYPTFNKDGSVYALLRGQGIGIPIGMVIGSCLLQKPYFSLKNFHKGLLLADSTLTINAIAVSSLKMVIVPVGYFTLVACGSCLITGGRQACIETKRIISVALRANPSVANKIHDFIRTALWKLTRQPTFG